MNEEQKKRLDDFFDGEDVEGLEELLKRKSYTLKLKYKIEFIV